MTGGVGIAVLIMRIAGFDPVAVTMGRITVVTPNPDVLPVPPFVMTGNPDSSMIRTLPLLVICLRRRRTLRTDMNVDEGVCQD